MSFADAAKLCKRYTSIPAITTSVNPKIRTVWREMPRSSASRNFTAPGASATLRARMSDEIFRNSFWYADAPAAPATHALEGEATADVAIVGAGYTGLSCALHLAERGARAIVLEAGEIGSGASGRNNGQVIPTFSRIEPDALADSTPPEQGGRAKGEQLVQLVADSAAFTFDLIRAHGMDCDAEQRGWVQPAHTPGRVKLAERRAAAWARRGAPVEMLDRAGVERITGSRFWHGGWLNRSGGRVQPLAFCRELARVAMAKGAQVFTGSRVIALSRQGAEWRVATAAWRGPRRARGDRHQRLLRRPLARTCAHDFSGQQLPDGHRAAARCGARDRVARNRGVLGHAGRPALLPAHRRRAAGHRRRAGVPLRLRAALAQADRRARGARVSAGRRAEVRFHLARLGRRDARRPAARA